MPIFSDLFKKSKGQPIEYNGKTLICIDRLPVNNSFKVTLKLISTNSEWKQAIVIALNTGTMTIDGIIKAKQFIFWEDNLRQEPNQTIIIKCKTKDDCIMVYNACRRIDVMPYGTTEINEFWNMGCAMIKGEDGIYYCNDFHPDDNFDDLVFQIKVE